MPRISRRQFVALAGIGAASAPLGLTQRGTAVEMSARDIVARIQNNLGVEWKPETVDTFKAGDPATLIKGIVTTSLATMNVLRQTVAAGANLIVTCEPTFYGRADVPTPPRGGGRGPGAGQPGGQAAVPAGRNPAQGGSLDSVPAPRPDPVFASKDEFIRQNDLVVWRFSDHWRLRRPDPFVQGLTDVLGWSGLASTDHPNRVSIPAVTLEALASHVQGRLNARGGVRVVGTPELTVQRVGVLPGSTPLQASLALLPSVDVILAGEVREWESVEYVRDAATAGGKKGLILVGRILSEGPGMSICARWLERVVPDLPVALIPAGDPYWRPM